jgi:S1-C subfamily serine protease
MMRRKMAGSRGVALVATTLLALLASTALAQTDQASRSGEGLFSPSEIHLSDGLLDSLGGVVRVDSSTRFRLTIFESEESASAARKQPGARQKEYLPEGGVIWPVFMSRGSLHALCEEPSAAAQPGVYELCEAQGSADAALPRTGLTQRVHGTASGFVVGRLDGGEYIVATAFHVAREAIERAGREGGVRELRRAPTVDLRVLVSADPADRSAPYIPARDVQLLANASKDEWQRGEDWALLAISADGIPPPKVLKVAPTLPLAGERVWVFGFPTRTVRDLTPGSPYRNANGDLRVSTGLIVSDAEARRRSAAPDLLSTADGVSGNSGSVVVNDRGEVVGLFRDHTATDGEADLRIGKYSGLAQIVPVQFFSHLVELWRRPR